MRIFRVVTGKVQHAISVFKETHFISNSSEKPLKNTLDLKNRGDLIPLVDLEYSDDDFYDLTSPSKKSKALKRFSSDKIIKSGFLNSLKDHLISTKPQSLSKYGGRNKSLYRTNSFKNKVSKSFEQISEASIDISDEEKGCSYFENKLYGNQKNYIPESPFSIKKRKTSRTSKSRDGENLGQNFDQSNEIDKISSVYEGIPPHLRRFVALQHIVYQVYSLLQEYNLEYILIEALLSRGASFQHFWTIDKSLKSSCKNKSVSLPKIFSESYLDKLYQQSSVFGNGSKLLHKIKEYTELSIENNGNYYDEYINLWTSIGKNIESNTNVTNSKVNQIDNYLDSDSDESWNFPFNDVKTEKNFDVSNEKNRGYVKWLMRLPEIIGSSRLLMLSLKLHLNTSISLFKPSISFENCNQCRLIDQLNITSGLINIICIKLCNNSLGILDESFLKPSSNIGAEKILTKSLIPSHEYLEKFLEDSVTVLKLFSDLTLLISSISHESQFTKNHIYSNPDLNIPDHFFNQQISKFLKDSLLMVLSFSMLTVTYYSKYEVSSLNLFKDVFDQSCKKTHKNPNLEFVFSILKNSLTQFEERSSDLSIAMHDRKSLSNSVSSSKKNSISLFLGNFVNRLAFWGIGPKDFLSIASIFDAAGLLFETKVLLLEVWKKYDNLSSRSNKIKEMRERWVEPFDKLNKTSEEASNFLGNCIGCDSDSGMPMESISLLNNISSNYNPSKKYPWNDPCRDLIVAYLEALDFRLLKNSSNKHQEKYSTQKSLEFLKKDHARDSSIMNKLKRVIDTPAIHSSPKKNIKIPVQDEQTDELGFMKSAFSFATSPNRINISGSSLNNKENKRNNNFSDRESLILSPSRTISNRRSLSYETKLKGYLSTPFRSPRSLYPYLKSSISYSTPSKRKK
ncbi:hypothetical protein AYI68_g2122 [Smittium mucronatum]|uniref:Uncharacterized protein n=1 Tax=Smittium mucronatum TaxID=133383 RepID=A0A1R0H3H8_9FUNG|nr:hypothetical protein AYI68_g2122 [Smittium mucronatum]